MSAASVIQLKCEAMTEYKITLVIFVDIKTNERNDIDDSYRLQLAVISSRIRCVLQHNVEIVLFCLLAKPKTY